jgi:hypothetical protein
VFVDIHWLTFPQKHIEVRVQHNFDDTRFGCLLVRRGRAGGGGGGAAAVATMMIRLLSYLISSICYPCVDPWNLCLPPPRTCTQGDVHNLSHLQRALAPGSSTEGGFLPPPVWCAFVPARGPSCRVAEDADVPQGIGCG